MNKQEYAAYLRNDHWQQLRGRKRSKVSKTDGKLRCAVCSSTGAIQTHHLQYKNVYDVLTEDLRLLCDTCHGTAHELLKTGELTNKYTSHHAMFGALKEKVKKKLGLTGKNLFKPGL